MSNLAFPRAIWLIDKLTFWRDISAPRGERLRRALEDLGPIFVKFGQVLSTRRDLMPADIADELARLQDRVPPFDSDLAIAQITKSLGAHPNELFASFEREPVASASIAQVHFATLKNGKRSRGQGIAARHEEVDRWRRRADAHRRRLGRETVGRRQAPEAEGSGGRIRQIPARRAGLDARSGQRQPAAAQFCRLRPVAGAGNVLGLLLARR